MTLARRFVELGNEIAWGIKRAAMMVMMVRVEGMIGWTHAQQRVMRWTTALEAAPHALTGKLTTCFIRT